MTSSAARVVGLLAASAGLHMAALAGLRFVSPPFEALVVDPTQFEIVEVEPEPDLTGAQEGGPEPETQPEPEKAPEVQRPKPKPKPKPKPEPEEEPPPAPEAPVDFTGVTLTAEGNSSWTSAVGSGAPITEPVGRIAPVTGRDRAGVSGGEAGGTGDQVRMLGPGDLSRRPTAPRNLDRILERNYPGRARTQGIEGEAVVRVRILPNGQLSRLRITRETGHHGFGAACVETLRDGGRWMPALDRKGRPGAYEVDFPCTFEVAF